MEDQFDLPVTYAIGDLHGEVTLLRQLLTLLPLKEQDTLVFLGDYICRTVRYFRRDDKVCSEFYIFLSSFPVYTTVLFMCGERYF